MKPRCKPKKANQQVTQCKTETGEPQNDIQKLVLGFVNSIERMEDEREMAAQTIADLYLEAKKQGLSPPLLREVIRLRKLNPHERKAYSSVRTTYMQATGLTP